MSNVETRLRKLEGDTRGRTQVLLVTPDMTQADIDAAVNRRLAAGTMDVIDKLHLIRYVFVDPPTHEEAVAELEAEDARR
jgi:hypothetical protein